MASKAKATNNKSEPSEAKAPETNPTNQATEWANQVINHLVDAQKKWIEITSQQNALALKAIEEGANFYRTAPTPELGAWARQGYEGFDAQSEGPCRW